MHACDKSGVVDNPGSNDCTGTAWRQLLGVLKDEPHLAAKLRAPLLSQACTSTRDSTRALSR